MSISVEMAKIEENREKTKSSLLNMNFKISLVSRKKHFFFGFSIQHYQTQKPVAIYYNKPSVT